MCLEWRGEKVDRSRLCVYIVVLSLISTVILRTWQTFLLISTSPIYAQDYSIFEWNDYTQIILHNAHY